MTTPDCLIAGDGAAGLFLARELLGRGLQVVVCGKAVAGPAASWAAGGILSPLEPWLEPEPITQLARRSQQLFPGLVAALKRDTGIDAEYDSCGMLVLEPLDHDRVDAWLEYQAVTHEWLDSERLTALEPAVGPSHAGGLLLPDVAQVRNPRLLKALRRDLQARGVHFCTGDNIRLVLTDGRCSGVDVDGERLVAGRVVVAAGAWSSELLSDCKPDLAVTPVRGQMLAFQAEPGLLQRMVLQTREYLIPRRDGLILAGSTLEQVGFDSETTTAAANGLRTMAARLAPQLADRVPMHHWSGLRPATADGLPYIGRHPGVDGLYVNYGHFRNGILLAPASAELLADIMVDGTDCPPAAAFAPDRHIAE
ncbi:glycine oxidase ThiO [Methylohalomonas lacus]|nr:glycine oxidase ThiO [Methylohalomonas lacus]